MQSSPAALALIAAEAQRLGALIALMLDFARVDAGRLALVVDDLEPEALLLEAFERLQALAPDRLQLAPSVEDDVPRRPHRPPPAMGHSRPASQPSGHARSRLIRAQRPRLAEDQSTSVDSDAWRRCVLVHGTQARSDSEH